MASESLGCGLESRKSLKGHLISIDIVDSLAKGFASFKRDNVLRYPRLDTVLMVEEAIQKAKEYPTKAGLLRKLPKKIMYQTFNVIIDYLKYSGKIFVDKDGSIVWVWNPKLVEKYSKRPDLAWAGSK